MPLRTALALLFLLNASVLPGQSDPAVAEAEIRAALDAEQTAFRSGECEEALGWFGTREPLLVVSGRAVPDRSTLAGICAAMAQNQARMPRTVEGHVIHVLGDDHAYSVSNYKLRLPSANPPVDQFVSKVWQRRTGGWVIEHMHESVAMPGDRGSGGPPAAAPAPGAAGATPRAPAPTAQPQPGSTEARLLDLNRRLTTTQVLDQDPSLLLEVTSDDYMVIAPGGVLEGREQVIRGLRAFADVDSIAIEDVRVIRSGNTAVVVSRIDLHGVLRGPLGRLPRLATMTVFRETPDGEWEVVSRSLTPCDPRAVQAGLCGSPNAVGSPGTP